MYEGEKLPEEQIAIITGSSKYIVIGVSWVYLIHVDGIPCKYMTVAETVDVLPGWHEIDVVVKRDTYYPTDFDYYTLSYYAMPGHKYRVESSFWKTKDALVTVVDTGSGEIVASQLRESSKTLQQIRRKICYWHKSDISIEQLKQDYGECKAKGQEKRCMEEKGYSWVHTDP